MDSLKRTERLVDSLQNPEIYDHPVGKIEVMETHISWVILTGTYAYKIKKPVNFGFLDFTQLSSRLHFCQEELRLNRRLAETIYLDVIAITGSAERPRLKENGEAIEYALRMRQFDQDDRFDNRLALGRLPDKLMVKLARRVADFHRCLPPLENGGPLGSPEDFFNAILENIQQIRACQEDDVLTGQLDRLESWVRQGFPRVGPQLEARRQQGLVRECHGDLHLANIALFDDRVTIFDCIEFNERFRWIDVLNDLAFLLMDLEFRDARPLAYLVLNTYLHYREDFTGVALLPYFKLYRALVRAKVSVLTLANGSLPAARRNQLWQACIDYTGLAEQYTGKSAPYLLITVGLSASGKSHVSDLLARSLGLIWLRSDVERKRLYGLDPHEASGSSVGGQIYTREANDRTYRRLATIADGLLAGGNAIIVDAACLRQKERQQLARVAGERQIGFAFIHCKAPIVQRRDWIRRRQGDASEATESLLDIQASWFEPFTEGELDHVLTVNTDRPEDVSAIQDRILQQLNLSISTPNNA